MIATDAMDLGALIRQGRQAQGWTQQDLADRVGTSRQWVISAEAGAPTAHLGLILAALRWVGMTIDVIPDEGGDDLLDVIVGGA